MPLKKLEMVERLIVKADKLLRSAILLGIVFIVLFPVGYTLFLLTR